MTNTRRAALVLFGFLLVLTAVFSKIASSRPYIGRRVEKADLVAVSQTLAIGSYEGFAIDTFRSIDFQRQSTEIMGLGLNRTTMLGIRPDCVDVGSPVLTTSLDGEIFVLDKKSGSIGFSSIRERTTSYPFCATNFGILQLGPLGDVSVTSDNETSSDLRLHGTFVDNLIGCSEQSILASRKSRTNAIEVFQIELTTGSEQQLFSSQAPTIVRNAVWKNREFLVTTSSGSRLLFAMGSFFDLSTVVNIQQSIFLTECELVIVDNIESRIFTVDRSTGERSKKVRAPKSTNRFLSPNECKATDSDWGFLAPYRGDEIHIGTGARSDDPDDLKGGAEE